MKKKKYVLPSMEFPFDLQLAGDETGINWVGKFLYRRPTLGERSMIAAMHARLNGDLTTLDDDAAALNEALSYLRFTLKDFPDWWKESNYGHGMYDANIIIELYQKVMSFEAKWRKKVHGGEAEQVEENDEESEDTGVSAPE